MKAKTEPTIEDAMTALREAQERYDDAHRQEQAASSRETDARNQLNQAQKTFDSAVAAVKKDAPWNSDWHQERKRAAQVEC